MQVFTRNAASFQVWWLLQILLHYSWPQAPAGGRRKVPPAVTFALQLPSAAPQSRGPQTERPAYLSWWSIPVRISHSEHSGEGFYRATQSWERGGLEMRHIGGGGRGGGERWQEAEGTRLEIAMLNKRRWQPCTVRKSLWMDRRQPFLNIKSY